VWCRAALCLRLHLHLWRPPRSLFINPAADAPLNTSLMLLRPVKSGANAPQGLCALLLRMLTR
jgi:hypothetical protein